jgi:flagellar hook-associated protein 1 FlgK
MSMGTDPTNPANMVVGVSNGASITSLSSSDAGGGAIAALMQFRNETIPSVENQIGQLAVNLSSQFNALQKQGVTPSGATGAAMFSTPTIAVQPSTTNTDTVGLTATFSNMSQVQASNYQLQVQGSNYVVTRMSDGTKTTYSGFPISVDGMSLTFTGITPPQTAPANGDVFNISPVQTAADTFALSITQGSQIASGSPIHASLGLSNTGTLTVGSLNLLPLSANPGGTTNANLTQTETLTFTGPTSYTVSGTGAPTGTQTYVPGQAINLNGWALTLNVAPATGDTVSVQTGANSAGDNRNLLLMNQLQTQQVVNGATFDQTYANIVGNVGALASNAQTNQKSQDAILSQAQAAQSSVSGVNLDEEASSLMQYQQQYQAAAQMINASTQIFNSLMTVLNAA